MKRVKEKNRDQCESLITAIRHWQRGELGWSMLLFRTNVPDAVLRALADLRPDTDPQQVRDLVEVAYDLRPLKGVGK
jgi:hypothetical protein